MKQVVVFLTVETEQKERGDFLIANIINNILGERMPEPYGTKYRGCSYAKVYEVFDEKHDVIAHRYSAKDSRRLINDYLAKKGGKVD